MGFYVAYKVGDKGYSPGKPDLSDNKHMKVKDGMPVCYIDEDEWGLPIDDIVSDECKSIFAIVRHSPELKPQFIDWLKPIGEPNDKVKYKSAKIWINFEEVGTAINDKDLAKKLRGKEKFDIFDARGMSTGLIHDATNYDGGLFPDYNAISTGAATVGSAGTYATWALAHADLANLTGNLTFTLISDVTETGFALITENLGGYLLKCTSDSPHNGDPTSGHLTTHNHAAIGFYLAATNGTYELEKVRIKRTTATGGVTPDIQPDNTAFTAELHDILIDGNSTGSTGVNTLFASTVNMKNVNIYNVNSYGIRCLSNNDTFENVNIYNSGINGLVSSSISYAARNVAIWGSGSNNYQGNGSATGVNCLSSDASGGNGSWGTGSGCLTSQSAASSVLSVDHTNASFLDIKPAGPMDAAGTSNILTRTLCIRGRAVPGPVGTSIGSAEILGGGVGRLVNNRTNVKALVGGFLA